MLKSFNEFKRMNEAIELPAEGETVQPRDKNELKDIIELAIKERGNEVDLNFIDTSKITDMSYIFYKSKFNGDISKWNTSKVKLMYGMFNNSQYNGDISKWNVSKVIDMSLMFTNSKFNSDISKWDVSKVEDITDIFKNSPLYTKLEFRPKFKVK